MCVYWKALARTPGFGISPHYSPFTVCTDSTVQNGIKTSVYLKVGWGEFELDAVDIIFVSERAFIMLSRTKTEFLDS